jgi:hypothetical protein
VRSNELICLEAKFYLVTNLVLISTLIMSLLVLGVHHLYNIMSLFMDVLYLLNCFCCFLHLVLSIGGLLLCY